MKQYLWRWHYTDVLPSMVVLLKCIQRYGHMYEWLQMGVGLVIGFVEHLQNVTTSNYSAIANSRSQQFIIARTKSSQSAESSPIVVW
jgi:hypothetical protein